MLPQRKKSRKLGSAGTNESDGDRAPLPLKSGEGKSTKLHFLKLIFLLIMIMSLLALFLYNHRYRELVAELLILQRQGDFEKKTTASEILEAKYVDGALVFRYSTPFVQQVNRESLCKAYLGPNNRLSVLWVSALSSVWEGDYAASLKEIVSSFRLVQLPS